MGASSQRDYLAMVDREKRSNAKRTTRGEHAQIAIRVDHHDVFVSAGLNLDLVAPEYALNLDERDLALECVSRLVIRGTGIDPKSRVGHQFEFSISGDDAPSKGVALTLKDKQLRDEYGVPKYRAYREREIPMYRDSDGIALLSKTRGQNLWAAWINVAPVVVSDMMVLLQTDRQMFISMHEFKEGRNRWIRRIEVQTSDPLTE